MVAPKWLSRKVSDLANSGHGGLIIQNRQCSGPVSLNIALLCLPAVRSPPGESILRNQVFINISDTHGLDFYSEPEPDKALAAPSMSNAEARREKR